VVTRNILRRGLVFAGVFSAGTALGAEAPWRGRVPPPPPLEVETAAFARAPERSRRPVEVVPEASVSLSSCAGGDGRERCEALGPGLGLGVAALYRANPYFAFGGAVTAARRGGRLSGAGELSGEELGLFLLGRVYLLEEGDLDPYLELALGWSSFRTTTSYLGGARFEDSAFGPSARAGGGVDYVVSDDVRLGVGAALGALVLGRTERCGAGICETGSATGGAMNGALVASLRLTWLLGDPL
jgi:hypothetical protein